MKFQECALSLAVLLVAATLSAPVRADLEKARQAFVDGDFETARREFTACAELGHPDAQFNLGAMYYNGNGGARNPALAFAWFLLAAENGIAEARAPLAEVQTQAREPWFGDLLAW